MKRIDSSRSWNRQAQMLAVLLAIMCAAVSGCATTPDSEEEDDDNDPFESINRPIFSFNRTLDRFLLRPVAKGYDTVA
ncbi:MAG: MlaA family lipoprotein, partial [Gammaproteobacteria bacterium]